MGLAALYAGYVVGSYIYHRITAKNPPKPKPASQIEVPRTDDGAAYPLVYGTCRVRSPILAWAMNPTASGSGPWDYQMDFLMLLGIPFEQAQVRIGRIWVDEDRLGPLSPQWTKAAGGSYFMDNTGGTWVSQQGLIGGYIEIFDGNASQLFVDPVTLVAQNATAQNMIDAGLDADMIPSYRGFAAVGHWGSGATKWLLGQDNVMGAYSYEVCSQPPGYPWGAGFNGFTSIDANPALVILDLLTGSLGKLKLPLSKIDMPSFESARTRLWEEGHGYSRSIEDAVNANEIIKEILEQIDGVLYEDPRDGLIKLKLIRDDYSLDDAPHITPSNCDELEGFAAGGYEGTINKVRVIFPHREDMYRDGSGTAHNLAVAAGQNGEVRELLIHMPGVCTQALADTLAARELAANSRPIAKFRALVDRSFRTVCPGDVVKVTWPAYGIDGRVFRVGGVVRGSLENGRIALDLIEDFFNVWRGEVLPSGGAPPPFPGGDLPMFEQVDGGGGTAWIGGGGGLSDGDKGDVTVSGSGTAWTIDNDAVTTSKIANDAVTFAKIQNIATQRLLGRATAGSGDVEELTGTAATALLDVFTSALKGLVPASGGGTANFLRADGTFATPPGTVTPDGLPFLYCTGHDGAVTFDGSTTILGMVPSANVYTLSRDIFVSSMTVNVSVTVHTNNFRIFCTGTLLNNGTIHNSGANASNATAGAAVAAQVFAGTAGGGAGPNGANGQTGSNVASNPLFPNAATSTGGLGGAIAGTGSNGPVMFRGGGGGGAATLRTGGTGGTVTIHSAAAGGPGFVSLLRGVPDNASGRYTAGSGGGSGGGPATGSGGGGGAGGGILFIIARTIDGSGAFQSKGGNGGIGNGNGTGTGGGGGGGGGGGLVVLAYCTRTGSTTTSVVGGTGGAGNSGGGAGGNGADGYVALFNLSGDGT